MAFKMKLPNIPKLNMQHWREYVLVALVVLVGVISLLFLTGANAHGNSGNHGHDINIDVGSFHEHENDTNGCVCVTGGISDSDLSKGLSLAMASGAHELDFSTQDWQLSATYAIQVNNDDEGAGSFKLGKRWDRFADVLMHVTYTPEQGQDYGDWVIVGGTVRF